jgi:hypothetical protein
VAQEKVAGLIASLGAVAVGGACLIDDYRDFGKDGFERDPPMPHHYMLGVVLLGLGVAGVGVSTLSLLVDLLAGNIQPRLQR